MCIVSCTMCMCMCMCMSFHRCIAHRMGTHVHTQHAHIMCSKQISLPLGRSVSQWSVLCTRTSYNASTRNNDTVYFVPRTRYVVQVHRYIGTSTYLSTSIESIQSFLFSPRPSLLSATTLCIHYLVHSTMYYVHVHTQYMHVSTGYLWSEYDSFLCYVLCTYVGTCTYLYCCTVLFAFVTVCLY